MTDDEILNANQEAIALAINSIASANALAIVAMASILDKQGVIRADQFATMMLKLADLVEPGAQGPAGAEMLRKVHAVIASQDAPKWKPTVVDGGAA